MVTSPFLGNTNPFPLRGCGLGGLLWGGPKSQITSENKTRIFGSQLHALLCTLVPRKGYYWRALTDEQIEMSNVFSTKPSLTVIVASGENGTFCN